MARERGIQDRIAKLSILNIGEGKLSSSSCTLCGQIRECLEKEIDGQEYDICSECWRALGVPGDCRSC